jgi:glycosyltransferase involved in cell wall biosynthesis
LLQKKLFIAIDWFTPAFKAGGPITSIQNLVALLNNDFSIFIYTSNADIGTNNLLENVVPNTWTDFDNNVKVFYADSLHQTKKNIETQIKAINPSVIYLNSIFSKHYSIDFLQTRKKFAAIKYVLAPRGMLKKSALKFKPFKKKIFLTFANVTNLYKNIVFQATDSTEFNDLQKVLKINKSKIYQVPNCPQLPKSNVEIIEKKTQQLDIVFVGRIHKIKNLHFLLQVLNSVKGDVNVTIVGNIEDQQYLKECESLIQQLPANIKVEIIGQVEPSQLQQLISKNHILCLPTQGENFGHAIFESLSIARPVVISDQTPWLDLHKQKAGFDLPLQKPDEFVRAIQLFVNMNQEAYDVYCKGAQQLAINFYDSSNLKPQYLEIF